MKMGYSADTRLQSEIYEDKVNENKKRYANKIELLKKQLELLEKSENIAEKNRIHVMYFGEKIKRNREKKILQIEEKRGKERFRRLLEKYEHS